MNLLVIGDVHGSYKTLKKLLDENWDKENEILIQVGDLIDRGNFSPQTIQYCKELKNKYPEKVVFIKGNHEFEMIEHFYNGPNSNWLRQCGDDTLKQYESQNFDIESDVRWFGDLPLYWENEKVFISHAGIEKSTEDPFNETNSKGVLWNRSELKNIDKMQIIGHTPTEDNNPVYEEKSNAWNVDTGAGYGGNLTGIKISKEGSVLEIIKLKIQDGDN